MSVGFPTISLMTAVNNPLDLASWFKLKKIDLTGKNCLDVGTGDGRHALAMRAEGAIVTAIDCDDSRFPNDEFIKSDFKDFKSEFKFDIVTVFLFAPNINHDEFIKLLKDHVSKDGVVIIGLDDQLRESPEHISYAQEHFRSVCNYEGFGLNSKFLVCLSPKD